MPFVLIKGKFVPDAGLPDGDSVRFKPKNLHHLDKLEGRPANVGTGATTAGTVQLRFEGIDAIEKGAKKPESVDAKQSMFDLIGYDETNDPEPDGYILARMTDDSSGRPICFAYAGSASEPDGKDDVYLSPARLKQSVNYQQMRAGWAYPLYYNTLFANLRDQFDDALQKAKADGLGYWPTDATASGVTVTSKAKLATIAPIWPKLWRRLEEYFRAHTSLAGFEDWLAGKNERIDLLDIGEEQGLQDVVKVTGNKVKLTTPPENIRVRGKAGRRWSSLSSVDTHPEEPCVSARNPA